MVINGDTFHCHGFLTGELAVATGAPPWNLGTLNFDGDGGHMGHGPLSSLILRIKNGDVP